MAVIYNTDARKIVARGRLTLRRRLALRFFRFVKLRFLEDDGECYLRARDVRWIQPMADATYRRLLAEDAAKKDEARKKNPNPGNEPTLVAPFGGRR